MSRPVSWASGLLLALTIAGVVVWPWLDPRFSYYVDDGFYHALRLAVFDHLLRRGTLFPRWWPDLGLGYGYPLLNYYSPGIYYLGELFHLLGASTYRALHLVAICSALLGAAGAYLLGGVLFRSPLAALVAAGVYVCAPYPFVTNLYNRSAFPEAMGLGLLPWLLAAGWLAVHRRSPLAVLGLAGALAVSVLMHSLSALIGAGLLVLWLPAALLDVPRSERRPAARVVLAGVGLGLALCAFFWMPAFFEQNAIYTELGRIGNLAYSRWLFDPLRPTPNPVDMAVPEPYWISKGTPFDLHWIYPHATSGLSGPAKPSLAQAVFWLASPLAGLLGWLGLRSRQAERGAHLDGGPAKRGDQPSPNWHPFPRAVLILTSALTPVLWFLNTTWSTVIWQVAPLLSILQFPWRLLGAFSLTLACFGAGIYAWLARRGQQQWVLAALLVVFVAVNALGQRPSAGRIGDPASLPPMHAQLRSTEDEKLAAGTTSGGEFLPRSVTVLEPLAARRGGKTAYEAPFPSGGWIAGRVWPYAGEVDVQQVWETPSWTEARVDVAGSAPAEVAFRTLVFPGWRAYVDGWPSSLRPAPFDPASGIGHGFAIVSVPPGEHRVQLALGPTVWRVLGTLLSIAGLGALTAVPLRLAVASRPRLARRLGVATCVTAALLGTAFLAAGLLPLWRPPGRTTPAAAAVILDLANAVRSGQGVQIVAPDGNAAGAFVSVREQTIGGHRRRWLYMHPPSQVAVQLDVPARAVFQAGLGLDPRGWNEPGADGVRFILEATDHRGVRRTLLDETVQPQTRAADQGWRFTLVDLGAYAGQRIALTLRTEG
ncbi:MAG: 6-pyruvoyl-tetrahydropterin synthase-related protein, partial [Chloroflexota bacterium]